MAAGGLHSTTRHRLRVLLVPTADQNSCLLTTWYSHCCRERTSLPAPYETYDIREHTERNTPSSAAPGMWSCQSDDSRKCGEKQYRTKTAMQIFRRVLPDCLTKCSTTMIPRPSLIIAGFIPHERYTTLPTLPRQTSDINNTGTRVSSFMINPENLDDCYPRDGVRAVVDLRLLPCCRSTWRPHYLPLLGPLLRPYFLAVGPASCRRSQHVCPVVWLVVAPAPAHGHPDW